MKVKDINAKTSFVVLVSVNNNIVCDNVGWLGDYEKYKNSTIKKIEPFHSRTGLYKDGIICKIKENVKEVIK